MSLVEVDLRKFDDFFSVTLGLYRTIGLEPFHGALGGGTCFRIFQWIIFQLGNWNLLIIVILEIVYLVRAFGNFSSFLEVTAVTPCIGFCLKALGKAITVGRNKDKLTRCIHQLRELFPQSKTAQEKYQVELHRGKWIIPLLVQSMIAIWIFNLYDICESAYRYYFESGIFVRSLPYFAWYPFSLQSNWIYAGVYIHQCHAGYLAASQIVGTDFLMYSVIGQLVMQFDFISSELEALVPTGKRNDREELKRLVKHHIQILRISEDISEVLNTSVLFNFLSSSFIICLTSFQVTSDAHIKDLIKYFLFLIYELFNILMICYYGNSLIDSVSCYHLRSLGNNSFYAYFTVIFKLFSKSYKVAEAAYNQQWFSADIQYKKDMLFLLTRAQKPSALNAISFSIVSLQSFNKVISTSYQFFALLRTVYRG